MTTSSIIEELVARGARVLSSRRFAHVQRVVEVADTLAHRFSLPLDTLRIAALTHDMHREKSSAKLRTAVERWQISVTPRELALPVLLHGPVSAAWLLRTYGSDLPHRNALHTAVRHHTLGAVELLQDPTGVGLALFIADFCEDGRSWPKKKQRRRILHEESLELMSQRIIELEKERYGTVEEPTAHMYAQLTGIKGARTIP